MDSKLARRLIVEPTVGWLTDLGIPASDPARVMLLAIGGQESGWAHRRQMGGGPARGWWQFEAIGVQGVLDHPASAAKARAVCAALGVPATVAAVHGAIEHCDGLACAVARLLLLTDAGPLPTEEGAGWRCYLRTWRPGRPHPETWPRHWAEASA